MNKEKVLLLIETNPQSDIFFKDWIRLGYKADVIFRKINKPLRALRRFWLKYDLFFSQMWYGNWFDSLGGYDAVILNMSRLTRHMPFAIHKKYPNLKIICWYWNTIDSNSIPIKTDVDEIEYWSFDEDDCKKYELKKNTQYYCEPEELKKDKTESDIYFVGRNKGREDKINEIRNIAENLDITCNFNIISDNGYGYIPYETVRENLAKTKAVLEINKKDQVGFTLRVLESLFYEIKLITDNTFIEQSPIYDKNNIFIINKDSYDDFKGFINGDYDHSVDKYKEIYKMDSWFDRFFSEDKQNEI